MEPGPPHIELTTDVITSLDGIRALTADYQHLYKVTGNTLPFALQEWHVIWCEHFLNVNPEIREQPLFYVLRDASADCVAIVPMIYSRRRLGLVHFATVDMLGSDPAFTEIRGPLVRPGYERPVVSAVHNALSEISDWHWVQWSGISGALSEAMTLELSPQWHEIKNDYVLDLPADWETFRAGLKRNVRESLRHCYNSLKRDGHEFEFIVAQTPAEVRVGLGRFLELHAMRANMERGVVHPNRFAGAPSQKFLHDVCASLAARGVMRLFQLKIGADIVAIRVGFVVGDSVYLYYSGFDPAWARYSVMTTTLAEALKYAMAAGLKTANLSLSPDQSKLRWRPRVVEYHSASVRRDRLISRIAHRVYLGALETLRTDRGVQARLLRSLVRARRDWD